MQRLTTTVRMLLAALAALALLLAAACGGDDPQTDSGGWLGFSTDDGAAAPVMADSEGSTVSNSAMMEKSFAAEEQASAEPAAAGAPGLPGSPGGDDGSGSLRLSPFAQDRVIVHTAYMSLVVDDVAGTVDRIAGIAASLGGWLVSSDRASKHTGAIAVRVPAQSLERALDTIESGAREVESRSVTSEDVTDRYVDTQSRLTSLRATEQRLLGFLEETQNVEEALKVQTELSSIQIQIEEMQGRLNYYDQVAAFSLVEVRLTLAPLDMTVDVGPDEAFRVGEPARFRATFTPPPDIDEFHFVWDFGDGSTLVGTNTAPTPDGQRVTATVNHVYEDDDDSPYIVSIELTGTGEGGIAEGTDSMLATVTEVPTIEVFAGESRTVEEGDEVRYTASFTAPDELWDYEYQWDFGDGSPTVMGDIDEGTRVEASHAYTDYRPYPYAVELTVSAMSDAGRISSTGSFEVYVNESEGFVVVGWDLGDTFKTAVRTLSGVGVALLYIIIWTAVFSPLIVVAFFAVRLLRRARNRYRASHPPRPDAPVGAASTPGEE